MINTLKRITSLKVKYEYKINYLFFALEYI